MLISSGSEVTNRPQCELNKHQLLCSVFPLAPDGLLDPLHWLVWNVSDCIYHLVGTERDEPATEGGIRFVEARARAALSLPWQGHVESRWRVWRSCNAA
jgi:hypothetical protein